MGTCKYHPRESLHLAEESLQHTIDGMGGYVQALLHSTHLYEEIKHALNHGIAVDGARVDLGKMMAQKDKAVAGLTSGIEMLFKKNKVGPTAQVAMN